ncbi:hypothetical protein TSMEX_005903 [Taenia solium]|eukprot:TsM_000726300 transcript=TsM_000726300 gene=TsM_000726300
MSDPEPRLLPCISLFSFEFVGSFMHQLPSQTREHSGTKPSLFCAK